MSKKHRYKNKKQRQKEMLLAEIDARINGVKQMARPMMKCGHASNAVNTDTNKPICIICIGIVAGADVIDDDPPDLAGRVAHCLHYGYKGGRNNECNYGQDRAPVCTCERPSAVDLPFFLHQPEKDYDQFYCGCHGWD